MSKNTIFIIMIGVLLMVAMGGGFFILVGKISSLEASMVKSDDGSEQEGLEAVRPIFSLDTMIVNLADQGGRRYLRVALQTELKTEASIGKLNDRLPQVKDALLKILSSRRFDDVNSTEGKNLLRDELIAKLNEILKDESVSNIYFTEFVIQ